MLKITKQNIKKTELLSKAYHYEKDIEFNIINDKIIDNLIIHILFDKDFDEKYYIKMIRADKLFNVDINDIAEFEDFYNVVFDELFDGLNHRFSDIKMDEISDITAEIIEKIQKVIKDENIIVDY